MAKISARGATKVAQASKTTISDDGAEVRVILALRSDGKILRKVNVRTAANRENYGSRGWNQGTYSITNPTSKATADQFTAFAAKHGYTID